MKEKMSRRSFITGAASLAAVGAVGLAGCSTGADSSESTDTKTTAPKQKTASETIETEVLVVGLGASGQMAATAAAKAGAKVLAIDTVASMAGTGNCNTTAPAAFGSKAQAEANPKAVVSVQEAYQEIIASTYYQENSKLLRAFLAYSGDCIDAAVAAGMPFLFVNTMAEEGAPIEATTGCLYLVAGEERAAIWDKMLTDAGAETKFGLTAETLLLNDQGEVAGVQCVSGNNVVDIKADAVILCTGGFLANEDMVKQYYAGAKMMSCGNQNSLGAGAEMALSAGSQMGKNFSVSMNEFGGANFKATPMKYTYVPEFECNGALRMAIMALPMFDSHGTRFMDEGIVCGHAMYSGEPLIRESTYYVLCDQAFVNRLKTEPLGNFLNTENPTNVASLLVDMELTNIEEDIDQAISEGWAAKADTFDELAKAFDLENLPASMQEYNGYCEKGFDEEYFKEERYLTAMTEGPYYLIQYNPSAWLTLGGIKTDEGCRALDANNDPVKNLYVAGADADLWAVPYVLPGSANGFCLASGWLAGVQAAEDIA